MGNVFSEEKPISQLIREQQRHLERSIIGVKRSQDELEVQEKTTLADVRKAAALGQQDRCKILAQSIVRSRTCRARLLTLQTNMEGVQLMVKTMTSTQALTESMRNVTIMMAKTNRSMRLPVLSKIMTEFSKQSMQMDLKQEMMDDALGNAMDDADTKTDTDQMVNQIMDEIGMNVKHDMVNVPNSAVGSKVLAATTTSPVANVAVLALEPPCDNDADRALETRLNDLKKNA